MRKTFYLILLSCILLFAYFLKQQNNEQISTLSAREKYSLFLRNHKFNEHLYVSPYLSNGKKKNKADRPDLAWEQDYLRTMDPQIGRPAPERLSMIIGQINQFNQNILAPGSISTPWVERGPNNVGGRTRAIVWDPNDSNKTKVWAGGVTGGLWFNNNITLATSQWTPVNDFWDNIAITSIAFDPNNAQIMYVGTGEGWGAAASRGAGIWKSTNGGSSWAQIASTAGFYYVNDLVVRNESGTSVVYAAVDGVYYNGVFHGLTVAGLQRSTNGGTSWTQVLPNIPSMTSNFIPADIEINSANRIWIGTRRNPYGLTDRGGGRVLFSDNGTTWTTSSTTTVTNGYGRVEVACAPSNANVVYAIIEDNNGTKLINKTINGGTNWSPVTLPVDADLGIPSTDFSRGQAWYDLIMAVDPNNENNVVCGGIDLFRTTNGGTSWTQISKWSNNNNLSALPCSYVHADQHALTFKPGSSSTLLVGNDGGVFFTSNLAASGTSDVFGQRNTNYNVTQFYACAIHPSANTNNYLAGAQDNGTQRFTGSGLSGTVDVTGGDGAYCFIDQTNPTFQITSYVYNSYYLSNNGGTSFNTTLSSDQNTGKFINPSDYDDNLDVLYSYRSTTTLQRIRNVTTTPTSAETVTITGLSDGVSHIRVSPYTTVSTTLFLGTDAGSIFKVTNANASPTTTNITGTGLPTGTISCIEIGANENELLVTFFNYGINSVWYTSNGGTNWVSKEGNLPDMPIRWSLFNPNNRNEVLLATELGVWTTVNLNATTPTWSTSNNGLANVRVDMLQMRSSDLQVTAATYGRGLFTSNGFATANAPAIGFTANSVFPCINETVTLTDTSLHYPTSWTWTITPNTFIFTNGTTATSKNPKVQFTASGLYTVTLNASNVSGNNQVTKNNLIRAGGFDLPFTENWETATNIDRWKIDNQDAENTWSLKTVGGNSPGTKAIGMTNFNYTHVAAGTNRDGLISPIINLIGYNTASLTFKYAYKRLNTTNQDSLEVYISTNCGNSWTKLSTFKETQSASPFVFITNSNSSSNFTPASTADWCGNTNFGACKAISLNAYTNNRVQIKFENVSGNGNNLYLDDISIAGVLAPPTPVVNFNASSTTPCSGVSVNLRDTSTNSPTSWKWTFTPATVTFLNNTNDSSQHPVVSFTSSGLYSIKLKATNGSGTDSLTKSNYITVTNSVVPTISIAVNDSSICSGLGANFTSGITNGGSTPIFQWQVNGNNAGTNASTFNSSTFSNGDTVTCKLTSNAGCVLPTSVVSKRIKMTVFAKPVVGLSLASKQTCESDTGIILSGGTPLGGTYSGTGVTGNLFKPLVAGIGNFAITYLVTDSNSCSNSTTDTVTVNANPVVTNIISPKNLCMVDTTVTLSGGSPSGGIYTGIGVIGNQFKTSLSGSGNFPITYTFTNTKGCKNKAIDTLFVHALPVVNFTLPSNNFCLVDTTINLSGGLPTGGIYTGTGVVSNQFKTSISGSGNFPIKYTVTNAKGCKNNATDTMKVKSLPTVGFVLSVKNICQKDTTVILNTGTPSGGVYSGNGVSGNEFKSQVSGIGNHPITYKFTAANSCSNQARDTMHINALPNVALVLGTKLVCQTDTTILLSGGTPTGGMYNGTGVTGNQFKPLLANQGKNPIQYTFTNTNGCTNKAEDSIQVNPLPLVTLALPVSQLCDNDTTILLTGGLPSGGIYTGTGVLGTQFKTSVSSTGNKVLQYRFTQTNGCSNVAKDSIQVNALPAIPVITQSGDTLKSNASIGTFQWYLDGNIIAGATQKDLIVDEEGIYYLSVKNAAGCISESDDYEVVFTGTRIPLMIHSVQLYPNPNKGKFIVEFTVKQKTVMHISITDLLGKIVYQADEVCESGINKTDVFIKDIARGTYTIVLSNDKEKIQRNVVVE